MKKVNKIPFDAPYNDPKYLGIPNINFSLNKNTDERETVFSEQRLDRGFDDTETWSLSDTIAKFIIPRLERYIEIRKEKFYNHPEHILDCEQVLLALQLIVKGAGIRTYTKSEVRDINKGLKKFSQIFMDLWW